MGEIEQPIARADLRRYRAKIVTLTAERDAARRELSRWRGDCDLWKLSSVVAQRELAAAREALRKVQGYCDEAQAWIGRRDWQRAKQHVHTCADVARAALGEEVQG